MRELYPSLTAPKDGSVPRAVVTAVTSRCLSFLLLVAMLMTLSVRLLLTFFAFLGEQQRAAAVGEEQGLGGAASARHDTP